jgi:uncharacterized protein with von Willebrand factor type A (vWA) domain
VGHALKVKTEAFINISFQSVHIKKITDIFTVLPTYVSPLTVTFVGDYDASTYEIHKA